MTHFVDHGARFCIFTHNDVVYTLVSGDGVVKVRKSFANGHVATPIVLWCVGLLLSIYAAQVTGGVEGIVIVLLFLVFSASLFMTFYPRLVVGEIPLSRDDVVEMMNDDPGVAIDRIFTIINGSPPLAGS